LFAAALANFNQWPAVAAAAEIITVEDIVVTAERRATPLRQLPLSLSAIDATALERAGLRSTRDLAGRIPNVSAQPGISNGTAAILTVRGIATSADETFGFDNPVGLYIDGIPLPRAATAAIAFDDIDHIEVLRGPQGTLFGRNTIAGAISLVPRQPAMSFGIEARGEIGNYGLRTVRGRIDSGLVGDGLRLAVSGRREVRDGFIDNRLEPDPRRDPGGGDVWGIRLAARADVTSDWTIDATADWTRLTGVPAASQIVAAGDGTPRPPVTVNGVSFAPVQPAPVSLWLANSQAAAGCDLVVTPERRSKLCLQDTGLVTDVLWGGLLRIEGRIGAVRLRSTTGYRSWSNAADRVDLDGLSAITGPAFSSASLLNGLPAPTLAMVPGITADRAALIAASAVPMVTGRLFSASNQRHSDQWSQEIDLRSDDDAAVQWVAGVIVIREAGSDRNGQDAGVVIDVVDNVLKPQFGALGETLAAGLPAGTRYRLFTQPNTILAYDVVNISAAAYAQAVTRFGSDRRFGVTGGLRLTYDQRRMARIQNGPAAFSPAEVAANRVSVSFTEPTGHLTLDWRGADDLLLWLRMARGYQSGGFNARQPTRLAAPGVTAVPLKPFAPESLWTTEIGARWSAGPASVSGAIFASRHNGKLVNVAIPDAPTFGTIIVNAGRIDYVGAEGEASVRMSRFLKADASVGYTHISVARFPALTITGTDGDIAPVVRIPNAPALTATAALTGTIPVTGSDGLSARLGWTHVGAQYFLSNPLTQPFAAVLRAPASNRFEADVRLNAVNLGRTRLTIAAWAQGWGKLQPVRGVDFGRLGFATLIYAEPARFGLSLALAI
jgi:iron complex outermembrane receptor protein